MRNRLASRAGREGIGPVSDERAALVTEPELSRLFAQFCHIFVLAGTEGLANRDDSGHFAPWATNIGGATVTWSARPSLIGQMPGSPAGDPGAQAEISRMYRGICSTREEEHSCPVV